MGLSLSITTVVLLWGGTDHIPLIYVIDAGQRDHQIIKYNQWRTSVCTQHTEMGTLRIIEKILESPTARAIEPVPQTARCHLHA